MPTVVALVPALVCALSWFGVGAAVPRRLLPADELHAQLTRVVVGIGVLAPAFYLAGRAGLFTRTFVVAATVLTAAVGIVVVVRAGSRWSAPRVDGRWWRALAALVLLALLVDVVASTAPPTSADALKYHLALPELWLHHGSIGDAFWRWESFNPFSVEMLFAQGLALAGGTAAGAVGGLLAVLAAAAVYGLARELGGSARAGLAGAALFVLQGLFTWEATSSFVELGLSFALATGLRHGVRYVRSRSPGAAAWCGACCGVAAGVKYVGFEAVVIAAPLLLGARRRRPLDLAWAVAAGLAACAVWYVKNWIVTGNPVYPVFFGGRWWTHASAETLDAIGSSYGTGSILRLPLLPLDLLLHGGTFDRGQYVGVLIFVFALLALVVARDRALVALVVGSVVYLVVWWKLGPQARFLLPALGALAAVGGAGAVAARGRVRLLVAGALAATAVAWALPTGALTRTLLPVTLGFESRDAYLERATGTHDALQKAAEDARGTTAFLGYEFLFDYPRTSLTLQLPEFAQDVARRTYVDRLEREHVQTLLVQRPALDQVPWLRRCVEQIAALPARYVTSRSLGTSIPIELDVYRIRPRDCA